MNSLLRTVILDRATHPEPHLTVMDRKQALRWEVAERYKPRRGFQGILFDERY